MTARIYNAFTLSMFASVMMSLNEWLEMRVNIGRVFFVMIAILFALQSAVKPLRRISGTFTASLVSAAISCAGLYFALGHEGLSVIPASIVREGLMWRSLTFSTINAALAVIAGVGLAVVFLTCRNGH